MEEVGDLEPSVVQEQDPVVSPSENSQSLFEQKKQAEKDMYEKLMEDMENTQSKLEEEGEGKFYYSIPWLKQGEDYIEVDDGSAFVLRHIGKSSPEEEASITYVTKAGVYKAKIADGLQDNLDRQKYFMRQLSLASKFRGNGDPRVIDSIRESQFFNFNLVDMHSNKKLSLSEDGDFIQRVFQGSVEEAKVDIDKLREEKRKQEENAKVKEEAERERLKIEEENRRIKEQQEMERIDAELEGANNVTSLLGNLTSGGNVGSE